jgi:hypothetical protein
LCKAESGTVTVETVLSFPVLVWALTASFTFTDVFRHESILVRSSYAVGDLVSSSSKVSPADIDGFYSFLRRMNDTPLPIRMRLSLIGWDEDEEELRVVWTNSDHAGSEGALDDATLNGPMASRIPEITRSGETLLLTETWMDYEPPFRVGLSALTLREMTLMRPRFAPGIEYDDPAAPPPPPGWCEFVVDGCEM